MKLLPHVGQEAGQMSWYGLCITDVCQPLSATAACAGPAVSVFGNKATEVLAFAKMISQGAVHKTIHMNWTCFFFFSPLPTL